MHISIPSSYNVYIESGIYDACINTQYLLCIYHYQVFLMHVSAAGKTDAAACGSKKVTGGVQRYNHKHEIRISLLNKMFFSF